MDKVKECGREVVLRTDGLSKNYGAVKALDELTLEVGRGEFVQAVGLGIVLLALAFLVNGVLTWAQMRGPRR